MFSVDTIKNTLNPGLGDSMVEEPRDMEDRLVRTTEASVSKVHEIFLPTDPRK
jgi:hypothetical protein